MCNVLLLALGMGLRPLAGHVVIMGWGARPAAAGAVPPRLCLILAAEAHAAVAAVVLLLVDPGGHLRKKSQNYLKNKAYMSTV